MNAEERALKKQLVKETAVRLREFRKSLGLTQDELAEEIDIPSPTQRSYERGNSEPGSYYFKRVKNRYPHVDVGYIFTGEPTIIPGMKNADLLPTKNIPVVASIPISGYKDEVPESDIIDWLATDNFKEPFLFALLVKGNSMLPEVRSGDYAVLAPASEIESGVMYAVFIAQLKLPILREIYKTDKGYKLVSADPHEHPLAIKEEELLSYYRLVEVHRKFT